MNNYRFFLFFFSFFELGLISPNLVQPSVFGATARTPQSLFSKHDGREMHLTHAKSLSQGLDQWAGRVLFCQAEEYPLMVPGCLQTHDKIQLSAPQSNLDCARSSSGGVYRCLLHGAESDRKTTHTSLFYSPVCQRCVMLHPLHCCHGK